MRATSRSLLIVFGGTIVLSSQVAHAAAIAKRIETDTARAKMLLECQNFQNWSKPDCIQLRAQLPVNPLRASIGQSTKSDGGSCTSEQLSAHIAGLEESIKRGEEASERLRERIAKSQEEAKVLSAEKEKLEAEKRQLQSVQTALTSGLIGAVVTACVALLGLFGNYRKSRVEKDYRTLELIEKAAKLTSDGISLPRELQIRYAIPDRVLPTSRADTRSVT
jgi:hypothetical protein